MKYTYSLYSAFLSILFMFLVDSLKAQEIAINEIMASNNTVIVDDDGAYSDWIEIYNYGSTAVDLQGFTLSDDLTIPALWTFPSYILQPDEYLLIWASSKDRALAGQDLHSNFKISSGGEDIILSDASGVVIDQVPAVALQTDVSYGRQPDGTGPWFYFYTSTPNETNIGTGLNELLVPPSFSHPSAYYSASFDLTLSHNNSNAQIIYTTDGSEPSINALNGVSYDYKNEYPYQPGSPVGPMLADTYTSNTFSSPINVYDRSSDPEDMAAKNTRQKDIYVPINPIRKAFVVKAKAYVNGIASETVSRTYFLWSQSDVYDIPIISIQIQEDHLFDYNDGIYTAGVDFDDWRAANPTNTQQYRPEFNNYWRRGKIWEYPMSVEMFESSNGVINSVLNINAGLRIHGNTSRSNGIKNLRLYARSEYD